MKYAKEDVGYRSAAEWQRLDPQHTGLCVVCGNYLVESAGCRLVEGLIAPGASCSRFEPMRSEHYEALLAASKDDSPRESGRADSNRERGANGYPDSAPGLSPDATNRGSDT